jgi:hypothetical protein
LLYISLNVAPPPSLGHHGGVQGAKIVLFSETAKKNDENLKKRPSEFIRSKRSVCSERWGSLDGAIFRLAEASILRYCVLILFFCDVKI